MSEVIQFNYLFRDSGNYKKFGSKLFLNPVGFTAREIEQKIRQYLIDQQYFYPDKVGIKKFKFHRYWDDYSWYEFESIEVLIDTDNNCRSKELKSINDFLSQLKKGRP